MLKVAVLITTTAMLGIAVVKLLSRPQPFFWIGHIALGSALSCAFLFDQWFSGLLLGALAGLVILPITYVDAVTTLPPRLTAPAIAIGVIAAFAIYALFRQVKERAVEAFGLVLSILIATAISVPLANRWNQKEIKALAESEGLEVVYVLHLRSVTRTSPFPPPHACAYRDGRAFGWSYSDYEWYEAPYLWRCALPRNRDRYADW